MCLLCFLCGAFGMNWLMQDHRQNELYASPWIEMVINHTCDEIDVSADLLLTQLLDSNDRLLNKVITEDTVTRFENLVLRKVCFAHCSLVSARVLTFLGVLLLAGQASQVSGHLEVVLLMPWSGGALQPNFSDELAVWQQLQRTDDAP
jgi:hypothetical protein